MENYEAELFKKETKDEITPEKAKRNLKSILVKFEGKIEQSEEGQENVRAEIQTVREDIENSGDVPEEYIEFEQRMEDNLEIVDELLHFIEQEQDRLEAILRNAEEDLEDGRGQFALNKIQNVEEVDSQRLEKAKQKFESEWSQLLRTSS